MKKKALSIMLGLSLAITSVFGAASITAKAEDRVDLIDSVEVIGVFDEVEDLDEIDASVSYMEPIIVISPIKPSETFYELKTRASEFDYSTLESSELKGVYGKIYKEIEKIYKEKNLSFSEDELELRTNLYWLSVLDSDYDNDDIFRSAIKYLDLTSDEVVRVLENGAGELFIDAEIESPKLTLYMLLFDSSSLSEEDKSLYNSIKAGLSKEYAEYEEQDIDNFATIMYAIKDMDLTKYGTQARVDILVDMGITLDEYIGLKLARLEGTNAEIVKDIYESVLLRNIDGDGLKYWTDKLESLIESGKSQSEAVSIIVDQLKSGQEFKSLLTRFDLEV